MTNILHTEFENPDDYEIRDVLVAFQEIWEETLSNFVYASPVDLGAGDKENVLALATSVLNLCEDYRRVANLLHGTSK